MKTYFYPTLRRFDRAWIQARSRGKSQAERYSLYAKKAILLIKPKPKSRSAVKSLLETINELLNDNSFLNGEAQ